MENNGDYSKEIFIKKQIRAWRIDPVGSNASRRSKKTKAKQAYESRKFKNTSQVEAPF
jgi:hypothetical protein